MLDLHSTDPLKVIIFNYKKEDCRNQSIPFGMFLLIAVLAAFALIDANDEGWKPVNQKQAYEDLNQKFTLVSIVNNFI
nr:unnamed protein product [Haemonchus contortus]